jgi:transcriptional regulator with XRE-family HTH domain
LHGNRNFVCAQEAQNGLPMKSLGTQVREFREQRGWDAQKMAAAVGTSRQNIQSLEKTGNRIPKYLGRLAMVMGRPVDDLLATAGLSPEAIDSAPHAGEPGTAYHVLPTLPWPFPKVSVERVLALSDDDRGYVQRRLLQAIQECEQDTNGLEKAQPDSALTADLLSSRSHNGDAGSTPGRSLAVVQRAKAPRPKTPALDREDARLSGDEHERDAHRPSSKPKNTRGSK